MTSQSRSRKRHPEVSVDLDDESVAKRLTRDLTVTFKGSSPDPSKSSHDSYEKMCSRSGNDWVAEDNCLYFGHRQLAKVVGKEIRRVSAMPFSDRVLTSDGNEMLTSNAIALIKKLSINFVDAGNFHVHDGPFGCIWSYPRSTEVPIIAGDRPFPYFYSHSSPHLKGRLFHTVRTSPQGRVVKFVKMGGDGVVPEELREQILYLVPDDGDWCTEVLTRFLPLDWKPSYDVSAGNGRKLQILPGLFETTDREKSFEDDRRASKGSLILPTVLEVQDGVVESLALDKDPYIPEVVKMVEEAAGKRVLVYRPLKETEDELKICCRVLKRVKRYDELVQKIRGSWPKTAVGLASCLSVTMAELIVAGIYRPDVRERFPGLYCFMESPSGCAHGTSEISVECEPDDRAALDVDTNEKDTRNKGNIAGEKDGIPVAFVMNRFYMYSPKTRSYYTINRPVDKPVVISSDGKVIHFTESDVPVAVLSTPYASVVCARLVSNACAN